jgi:acetolactate synthase-1/2/3 large subunit
MVRRVTKYAHRVTTPTQAVFELQKAVHIALDQRPGPCWIEIPMDIQASRIDPSLVLQYEPPAEVNDTTPQLIEQIDSVIDALLAAQRPLLWLGHGRKLSHC